MNTFTPTGVLLRKGLKGRGAAAQAAEPPQSPVFCGYCRKKCAQLF
jgi:hypothetical protein